MQTIPGYFCAVTEEKQKLRFAELLYGEPENSLKHAEAIFSLANPDIAKNAPGAWETIWEMSKSWPQDDIVWDEIQRLKRADPPKKEFIRDFLVIGRDRKEPTKDRLVALWRAAELCGYTKDVGEDKGPPQAFRDMIGALTNKLDV